MKKNDVLIVVDAQNDFLDKLGTLIIDGGLEVLPVISAYITRAILAEIPIYFTKDWHPPNHMSFKSEGGDWPTHCVRNTWGAGLHRAVFIPDDNTFFVLKGRDPDAEEYSAFAESTKLGTILRADKITRVIIVGFATDFCVKATALDALKQGFEVVVCIDAIKEVFPDKRDEVLAELVSMGAKLAHSGHIH